MIHLAGAPVQADTLVVQRCALCGCRLVFEYRPEVRGESSRIEVFSAGDLVESTTDPETGDVHHSRLLPDEPLEMPYPDHHILNALGGLLCTEVSTDDPLGFKKLMDDGVEDLEDLLFDEPDPFDPWEGED